VQKGGAYFSSTFAYSEGTLTQTVIQNGYPDIAGLNLDTIRIFGANGTIDTISVNGQPHTDFEILPSNEIYVRNLKIPVNSRYTITFTTADTDSNGAQPLFGYSCILLCVTFLYHLLTAVPRPL